MILVGPARDLFEAAGFNFIIRIRTMYLTISKMNVSLTRAPLQCNHDPQLLRNIQ